MNTALRAALFSSPKTTPAAWLTAFMAGQADGFDYDFSQPGRLLQGTDEATPVLALGDPIGRANDRRTGPNSPRHATQATASFKPRFQASGAVFDGSDDALQTSYTTGTGANFVVAKVAVSATVGVLQVIAGSRSSTDTRFFLSINSSGQMSAGVGTVGGGAIVGGTDQRGKTVVVGLSNDGAMLRLFVDNALVDQRAQVGAVGTIAPIRLGALNDSGTQTNYFGGSIARIVAGRQFLDLETFNKIAAAL